MKWAVKKLSDVVKDLTEETVKLRGMVHDVVKDNRRISKALMVSLKRD